MWRYIVLFTTVFAGLIGNAHADSVLLERGRAIAAERCARCHAVGEAGASPHKIVPPLRDLGERFPVDMLQEALKTGVVGGHDEMPMFDIGEDGAKALVTYIDSLSGAGPKYLTPAPK